MKRALGRKLPGDRPLADRVAGVPHESIDSTARRHDGEYLFAFVQGDPVALRQPDKAKLGFFQWTGALGMSAMRRRHDGRLPANRGELLRRGDPVTHPDRLPGELLVPSPLQIEVHGLAVIVDPAAKLAIRAFLLQVESHRIQYFDETSLTALTAASASASVLK
jgi:hypothetical protein